MDYIEETGKILKYFDFKMTEQNLILLHSIKKLLNYDYCLIGSFFRDYLTIKNNFNEINDKIFDEFLLFIDNRNEINTLYELLEYAKIYNMIVFEKAKDKCALWGISTVNSCYKVEFYPILMQILYMYYNLKTDSQTYNIMLQSLVDITIKSFANPELVYSLKELYQAVIENNITPERYAG